MRYLKFSLCKFKDISGYLPFFLLLIYETCNYYVSAYQPNSILFLRGFLLILCCVLLLDLLLLSNKKYQLYFVVFISLLSGLLALLNIPIFFFRYYESAIYGFDDFSQFRFLYMPLGFLSNEWVTILLCFLPFPVIGLFHYWNKRNIRYGFLPIIGLLVFNILVSFSRAGILAFLLFVGLLNIFFYFNRIVSTKKIIVSNVALLFLLASFAFCFSESIRSSIHQTNSHQRSTEGRLRQWEQVSDVIKKYPVFGIGSKNYALIGRQFQEMNLENSFSGRVNNTYIQLAVEKGWTGLFLWLCVIGIYVFISFKQIRKGNNPEDKAIDCIVLSAIITILFRELFFSSLFCNSGILLLFCILLIFNKKEYKTIRIRQPLVVALVALLIVGTAYFYVKKPGNALSFAAKGLECERSCGISVRFDSLNKYSTTNNNGIAESITLYKKACRLNPYDALFQHNLGWLYWINLQPDSALIHISKAIKLEPNDAVYYISKGLLIEPKNPDQAFETYKQALLLSPDIADSQFFDDLKKRDTMQTSFLLKSVYDELLKVQSVRYSSVIEAKIGKVLLSLGEPNQAYEMLNHVSQIHPNLSRPWYYLGFIEQEKGNFDAMQAFYKKSLFLSPFDHLPLYAFASYYRETEKGTKSDSYYKAAEKAWKDKRSVHSVRCKRMYYSDTEKDDVIPQGLLDYITPIFQIQVHDKD